MTTLNIIYGFYIDLEEEKKWREQDGIPIVAADTCAILDCKGFDVYYSVTGHVICRDEERYQYFYHTKSKTTEYLDNYRRLNLFIPIPKKTEPEIAVWDAELDRFREHAKLPAKVYQWYAVVNRG